MKYTIKNLFNFKKGLTAIDFKPIAPEVLKNDTDNISETYVKGGENKMHRRLRTNEIVKVYFLDKKGYTRAAIAEKMGVPKSAIESCMRCIKKNWVPKHKLRTSYTRAVSMIRVELMNDAKEKKRKFEEKYNKTPMKTKDDVESYEEADNQESVSEKDSSAEIYLKQSLNRLEESIILLVDERVEKKINLIKKETQDTVSQDETNEQFKKEVRQLLEKFA